MTRHGPAPWRGESYYGQPPLKNPQWDWKVSGYIALAGISGAAQALAWIGSLRDRRAFRGARRNARLIAMAGMFAGSALLIADLKKPQRFHNMLRIFRPTSPMSFGSSILGAFGIASAASMLEEVPAARRRPALRALSRVAQVGAALTGAGAATYTAALLSATSNPHWAAAPRMLGVQFGTSAVGSGAAALALAERAGGRQRTAERLEEVAAVASAAHIGATLAAERRRRAIGVEEAVSDRPFLESPSADLLVAGALPLAAYAIGRASRERASAAAVVGSLAVLAGGWLMREGMLRAGKRAARRPKAAFRLAQPQHLPRRERRRHLKGAT